MRVVKSGSLFSIVAAMLLWSLAASAQQTPPSDNRMASGQSPDASALQAQATAQPATLAQGQVIAIWEDVAPGSQTGTQTEQTGRQSVIRNVDQYTLTAYLPEESKANGTAVIVCPGGAFRALSWMDEGVRVAQWLNQQGIAAFVLRYHLLGASSGRPSFPMAQIPRNLEIKNANANPEPGNKELAQVVSLATEDGRQAIRIVRQNAKQWNVNPRRIGIMGFSAGGGVAVGSVLDSEPEERPDFVATLYGPALVDVHVPADAPPLFIAVAADHLPVSTGCVALYTVWKAAGKSAELHVYSHGRAGFGMRQQGLPSDTWTERFHDWLKVQGFCD
jgi:acetyl esterase/lipase